jgi:hypothetical protein
VGRSSEPLAGYWIDGVVHSPLRIIENAGWDKRQGQVGDLFDYRDLGAITGS